MRVGIVGDIHLPFVHPMYLRFCLDIFSQWKVDHVHFVGDIVDLHALSFHDPEMDAHGAADEARLALETMVSWQKAFRRATVSIGNHDERHFRRAKKYGIPSQFVRPYEDVWQTPHWDWKRSHIIDGVVYEHGTGTSGKDAAYNRAIKKRRSCVIGHIHAHAGVKWHASDYDRIFGMNAGCGIDLESYAFCYSNSYVDRPILGCGIVLDGTHAFYEVMPCGPKEEYHRTRA